VCLRAFKKFEIGDPSYKFWNKEQQDRYKATVMPASVLVKKFGDKAVLDYLNGAGWNIAYIGYFKKIPDYILAGVQKSKEKLDALANVKIEKEVIEEFVKPKPVAKKQTGLFGKLKNIDG
jgi:hypothetical protein